MARYRTALLLIQHAARPLCCPPSPPPCTPAPSRPLTYTGAHIPTLSPPPRQECYNLKDDPLEVRNIAYPGAAITRAERAQLARLKAKLLHVTAARLGPIPGFKWNIDINANVTGQRRTGRTDFTAESSGRATGLPIGSGDLKISWGTPRRGQAKGTFAISARTGQIVGTALATVTARGNTLTYVGSARITGGSGAYRGFTSWERAPLLLRMTSSTIGAFDIGHLTLVGRVTSARVSGALTLTPLNPANGL